MVGCGGGGRLDVPSPLLFTTALLALGPACWWPCGATRVIQPLQQPVMTAAAWLIRLIHVFSRSLVDAGAGTTTWTWSGGAVVCTPECGFVRAASECIDVPMVATNRWQHVTATKPCEPLLRLTVDGGGGGGASAWSPWQPVA